MNTAINNAGLLTTAIAPTAATSYWTTPFPTSSLGNPLKRIARLIQAAPTLGHQRQIFASIGGLDLHGTEGAISGAHAGLLADLSRSMNACYQATAQLHVDNGVTAYTASDFNRTFPVNGGAGTDHGRGNHQIVMGGGGAGGQIYGTLPTPTVGGSDDTTTGR